MILFQRSAILRAGLEWISSPLTERSLDLTLRPTLIVLATLMLLENTT